MKKAILRRRTKQRKTILEELSKVKSHPTADAIFRMVRKKIPTIGFGTVYRNLNLLRNEDKILELAYGKGSAHYDADTDNHYHLFCIKCKRVFDANKPALKSLKNIEKKAGQKSGFLVKYYRLDFYGYCRVCK